MSFILLITECGNVIMCNLSKSKVYNFKMVHKSIVPCATRGTSKQMIYREIGEESPATGTPKYDLQRDRMGIPR